MPVIRSNQLKHTVMLSAAKHLRLLSQTSALAVIHQQCWNRAGRGKGGGKSPVSYATNSDFFVTGFRRSPSPKCAMTAEAGISLSSKNCCQNHRGSRQLSTHLLRRGFWRTAICNFSLGFPEMQRWIVKYFFQAGSLQRAGLDIDVPILCQQQRSIQIVICDVERRAVE
jgi:hypothetical protein